MILVLATAVCSLLFADEPAIEWTGTQTDYGGDGPFVMGFRFSLAEDTTITALGAYDAGGNGLQASHTVGIWLASNGSLVVSAFVPDGTQAELDGHFRYTEISDTVLPGGAEYIVAASQFGMGAESDSYAVDTSGIILNPKITWLSPRTEYTPSGGFLYPTTEWRVNPVIGDTSFGGMFKIKTAQDADRFDYPIGNQGLNDDGSPIPGGVPENITVDPGDTDMNSETNDLYAFDPNEDNPQASPSRKRIDASGGWFVLQDTGNYNSDGEGIHPGEDWNYGSAGQDVGMPVYAVANGLIMDIRKLNNDLFEAGYAMVIRHTIPNGEIYDSVYVHIAPDEKDAMGTPNTGTSNGDLVSEERFSYQEGDIVERGDTIGVIADIVGAHLHFEMRNKPISPLPPEGASASSDGGYWPNDTDFVYYGAIADSGTMTLGEVESAFADMRLDGIIDPSDFIDAHRLPKPKGQLTPSSVDVYAVLRQSIENKISKLVKKIKAAKKKRSKSKAKKLAKKLKKLKKRLQSI